MTLVQSLYLGLNLSYRVVVSVKVGRKPPALSGAPGTSGQQKPSYWCTYILCCHRVLYGTFATISTSKAVLVPARVKNRIVLFIN